MCQIYLPTQPRQPQHLTVSTYYTQMVCEGIEVSYQGGLQWLQFTEADKG